MIAAVDEKERSNTEQEPVHEARRVDEQGRPSLREYGRRRWRRGPRGVSWRLISRRRTWQCDQSCEQEQKKQVRHERRCQNRLASRSGPPAHHYVRLDRWNSLRILDDDEAEGDE